VVGMRPGTKYVASQIARRYRDHALFVSFAPADDPKIVVAVLVENGGHGGSTAAPVARKVIDYWLLGKLPDSPVPAAPVAPSSADTSAEDEDSTADEEPPAATPEAR